VNYYSYYTCYIILNMNWFMVVFDRLWSGRAVTEHRYVFLFFVCVYMYVSNHFNHCIKLFAPCGPLIGNTNSYSYSILIVKMSKLFCYQCDVKVFLTFTSLILVLFWQLFYLFCSSIVYHHCLNCPFL
jgi:hypothetical protein